MLSGPLSVVQCFLITWMQTSWKVQGKCGILSHAYLVCCCCLVTELCLTLWDSMDYIACQALLPMEFSRQKSWSELPFSSPGKSSQPRDQTSISCLAGRFCTLELVNKLWCRGRGSLALCLEESQNGNTWCRGKPPGDPMTLPPITVVDVCNNDPWPVSKIKPCLLSILKKAGIFPGGPMVVNSPVNAETLIQSLVRELRSHR